MENIKISLLDLMDIICEYDEDKCEANPLNASAFCKYIFQKYEKFERNDYKCPSCGHKWREYPHLDPIAY